LTKTFSADKGTLSVDELFVIKCKCGARILMLPNVKMMGKAIDEHVAMHRLKMEMEHCTEADAEAEEIRDFLTTQTLEKASDSSR
jgi:hypothetical protein